MAERAEVVRTRLSRLGARLGNWNDRRHYDDWNGLAYAPRSWRIVNRVAGWLYVKGDPK